MKLPSNSKNKMVKYSTLALLSLFVTLASNSNAQNCDSLYTVVQSYLANDKECRLFVSDGQTYAAFLDREKAEFKTTLYGNSLYRIAASAGTKDDYVIFSIYDSEENMLFTNRTEKNVPFWDFKVKNTFPVRIETELDPDKQNPAMPFEKEYFKLNLEISDINFFPLTWTAVHKVDEDSPLYNLSFSALEKRNVEVIVLVKAFDETFSQEIFEKHSYAHHHWKQNVKFKRNFKVNDKGVVELYVDQLNDFDTLSN